MFCSRWISYVSYSVNKLPPISTFLAVPKGNIMSEILLLHHFGGSKLRLESLLNTNSARLRPADQEQEQESEEPEPPSFRTTLDAARDDSGILLHSISVIRRELPQTSLGWPLLGRKSSPNQEFNKPELRDISVVEWVMSLPDRVTGVFNNQIALHSNQTRFNYEATTNDSTLNGCKAEEAIHSSEAEPMINDNTEISVSFHTEDLESNSKPGWPLLRVTASTTSDCFSEYEDATKLAIENHLPKDLELRCKLFSLRDLKQATSGFSPGKSFESSFFQNSIMF